MPTQRSRIQTRSDAKLHAATMPLLSLVTDERPRADNNDMRSALEWTRFGAASPRLNPAGTRYLCHHLIISSGLGAVRLASPTLPCRDNSATNS